MTIWDNAAPRWMRYRLGLVGPATQTTAAERACLARHAAGRRCLVELGVMHGVTTAVLRAAMAGDGVVYGIDPHPRGRLGVSFERLVAQRELRKHARGSAVLIRQRSHDAVRSWEAPIDFLFIDADHSWDAIAADWNNWTPHVVAGGCVGLHDSRSVPGREDYDSVRFTSEVVLADDRFRLIDAVDSLTIVQRRPSTPSRAEPVQRLAH